MTTYRISGFKTVWSDTNGDGLDDTPAVFDTEMMIVAPGSKAKVYWGANGVSFDTDEIYSLTIDGSSPPASWDESGGTAAWGKGKLALWYETGDDDLEHVFVLKGDTFPAFADDDEIDVFEANTTWGPIGDGSIRLSRIPDVRVSENDRIVGDSGDNVAKGGKGKDKLLGKAGSDTLDGGKGKDLLDGGTGYDTLMGGKGDDTLIGGKGRDTFVFRMGDDADTIVGFDDDRDTLRLDETLWSDSHGDLSRKQVLRTFGSDEGDSYVLDFGDGDVVTIEQDISRAALINDLAIV